jgi:hypothetical protein
MSTGLERSAAEDESMSTASMEDSNSVKYIGNTLRSTGDLATAMTTYANHLLTIGDKIDMYYKCMRFLEEKCAVKSTNELAHILSQAIKANYISETDAQHLICATCLRGTRAAFTFWKANGPIDLEFKKPAVIRSTASNNNVDRPKAVWINYAVKLRIAHYNGYNLNDDQY